MTVTINIPVVEHALWAQRDARDPLGVWAARNTVGGDGSGHVAANIVVPAARRRSHIYTCIHAITVLVGGTQELGGILKCRLLTNWPDATSEVAGVTGFATYRTTPTELMANARLPNSGPARPFLEPNDRYVLLFDPSVVAVGSDMTIVEIDRDMSIATATYAFEAYGYYWDRGVLDAPGGPRHPGAF